MNVNTNVYGEQSSWLDSYYLSTGQMKTKCANFTGGNTLPTASTLGAGNTANKTPHNQLIDRSISFSALGTESIYSHILYWTDSNTMYTDNEIATEFFFCTNDNSAPISNTDELIYSNNATNFWKIYYATNNKSDILIPITEINPKKILYLLHVMPVNANGEPAPFISGVVDNYRFMFIGDYAYNVRNIRTDYPYIQAARLVPRVDNSNTSTPSRSALSGGDYEFGIAINREFTAIPDNNLKINYCQFISIYDKFNIPLWGHRGYFNQSADYNVILANSDDIQTGIIEYSREYWIAHEWDDDFYDYLVRQAACFGVYVRAFSGGGSAASLPLTDDSVILGLLDEQGIGHGEYTRGAANRDNPIYSWSSYSESPYDYSKPVDPTHYDNTTGFYSMSPVWSCNRMYVTTEDNIMKAAQAIATAISLKPQDQTVTDYSLGSFLTNNPVDCIISIKKYPIQDIPKGTTQNIKFGAYENNQVQGAPLQTMHDKFDFIFTSGNNIFPAFGDSFLDYEPYTHAELIIPFCGSVQLPMADFMNATIKVKLIVDYITGACTAYVCKNDLAITSISGQIGIEVPISGVQGATLESQIVNANLQYKAQQLAGAGIAAGAVVSTVGAVGSVATGNAIGAIGSAGGLVGTVSKAMQHEVTEKAAEYAATHVQVPFKQVCAGSPLVSGVYEYSCRLIIYRPILDPAYNPEEYGHTVGFATIETGSLNQHTGLVQVASVDLSGVPCTVTESQMIEAALKEGVYV